MPDIPHSDSPYDLAPKAPQAPTPPQPAAAPDIPLRPIDAPVSLPAVAPAEPWTCSICHFTADAKPRRGVCPECGAPADPRATGLLQYSIPSWIRYLSNGVIVLFSGVLLHVIAVIVAYGWDAYRPGTVIQIVASFLEFVGIWVITSREPHLHATRSPLAFPTRFAGLVALLIFGALVYMAYHFPDASTTLMIALALLATATVAFLTGFQLRHLALRIPSDSLASHTLNLAWIIAAACLFIAVLDLWGFIRIVNEIPGKLFMFTFPITGLLVGVVAWAEWTLLRLFLNLRECALAAATPPRRRAVPNTPGIL